MPIAQKYGFEWGGSFGDPPPGGIGHIDLLWVEEIKISQSELDSMNWIIEYK